MIQILALREVGTAGKKAEVWFEKGIRAASVEEVFANYAQIVQKIPPSERWNVYYTVADCFEERGRRLEVQHHLPFDVDGIAPGQSDEQLEMLARLVCDTIGVPYEKCGVLFSGNGLQIIVGTTSPITEIDEFDLQRTWRLRAQRFKVSLTHPFGALPGSCGFRTRRIGSPVRTLSLAGC